MPQHQSAIAALVADHTRDIEDFPSPGVMFKDLTPLFADATAFGQVLDALAARHEATIDVVAGVEARGFVVGAPLAQRMGVGFVPIRKKGKLPGDVVAQSYDLKYGSATIEMHRDAVRPGARVLVVDDVLATGGTAIAACELVEKVGGTVAGFDVLVELAFLGGRARLDRWAVHTGLVVN